MTTIRVGADTSYDPPENAYQGEDGSFIVTLFEIDEPRVVDDSFNPGAKRTVQEWRFAIEGGDHAGQVVYDPWVSAPKDGVIHPKSKFYGYMTALFGKAAPEGTELDIEKSLIGRQAIATVEKQENGAVKILNLGALPAGTRTAAPTNGTANGQPPLREQVEPAAAPVAVASAAPSAPTSTGDDLPF